MSEVSDDNNEPLNEGSKVKHIADIVGEWGKWQFQLALLCFLFRTASAINSMGYSFLAYNNDYYCSDVPIDAMNKTKSMKCFKYGNESQKCTEWQYDRSVFETSITTEFDLVCERRHYTSISQAFFMLGYLVSGLVLAHYSDKYGRRPIVWITSVIELVGVISCALSPNVYMFILSRFMMGAGSSGKCMAMFTILLECSGPKHRSDLFIMGNTGWILGYAITPGLAYWLQDYRSLQWTMALPLPIFMGWFHFMYESPRWQITNGQLAEAEHTLRRALKMNGKSVAKLSQQMADLSLHLNGIMAQTNARHEHSIVDLLRTKNIRHLTLIIWYTWAVNTLIYYGISFNTADLGGNFYTTFLLSGLVEVPGSIIALVALRFFGRSRVMSVASGILAVMCFAVIAADREWLRVLFALLGKCFVGTAFCVMTTQGPELYPTVLRNIGQGASSVVGRVGSISAPFMKNLAASSGLSVVMALYGTLSAVGAVIVLFLPETKGREIPDTIEEIEGKGCDVKMIAEEEC